MTDSPVSPVWLDLPEYTSISVDAGGPAKCAIIRLGWQLSSLSGMLF